MRSSDLGVLMPEYLRSEEKGMISTLSFISRFLAVLRSFCFKAALVALSAVEWLRMAVNAASRAFLL